MYSANEILLVDFYLYHVKIMVLRRCVFCRTESENLISFNRDTVKMCRNIKKIRRKKNSKYGDLKITFFPACKVGYHSRCYEKFITLPGKYYEGDANEEPDASLVSSLPSTSAEAREETQSSASSHSTTTSSSQETRECQNLGVSGDVAISYVDSDSDELPIDSKCEYREALEFARSQTEKCKNVLLSIDKMQKQELSRWKDLLKQSSLTSACDGLFVFEKKTFPLTTKNEMAPIHMTGVVGNGVKLEDTPKTNSCFASSSSENAPPAWFRSYMDSMKREIVEEVSTKVTSDIKAVLASGPLETCVSYIRSMRHNRHFRDLNTEEKQRRKKKKQPISEAESSDAFSPPQQPYTRMLRNLKKIETFAHNVRKSTVKKQTKSDKMKNSCQNAALLDNILDKRSKGAFVPILHRLGK